MPSDPILEEVYKTKDRLARQYGGDAHKLFEHFREAAKQHPERMVNLQQARKKSRRKRVNTKP